jgi:hypothetical protein
MSKISSVVDPHHVDADPDSDFYLMRIRMLTYFLRMWIRIRMPIQGYQNDADPDTQHCK